MPASADEPVATQSATASTTAAEPRLRLGVGHLLLWMTGIAICLATYKLMVDASQVHARTLIGSEFEQSSQNEVLLLAVVLTLVSPFTGAGVGGLLLALIRLVARGPRFPTQAGHWLLVRWGAIQ